MKLLLENWRQYLNEGSDWGKRVTQFKTMLLKDHPNSKITNEEDWAEDEDMGWIIGQGKYWNQEKILSQGLDRACHGNAACAYKKTNGQLKMITGVGLSEDDVWYLHSWVYDPKRDIIYETTGDKWKAHYGFQIPDSDMGMIQSRGDRGNWLDTEVGDYNETLT